MNKNKESYEISETRRNIVLFMLSSVVFGIVLAFLSWSIEYLIPSWLSPWHILGISVVSLLALGFVAFRLMIPPLRVTDTIDCYMVQDMKTSLVLSPSLVHYDFWHVAAYAFQELIKADVRHSDFLRQPIDLHSKLLKQFMMYAILKWLGRLPGVTMLAALRTRVPIPPRIYRDRNEKMRNTHPLYYTKAICNSFLNVQSLKDTAWPPIRLPRNMKLEVSNERVVMSNRYVRIEITSEIYQWSRGMDLRMRKMLRLTDDENQSLGSLSAAIRFDARLSLHYAIFPRSERYWEFAKDTLENLRAEYDWGLFLEDVKEFLTWESLTRGGA